MERPIENLIKHLMRLPTIGPKTALRLAFYILSQPKEEIEALSAAMLSVKERMRFCSLCGNIAERELCRFCSDGKRDRSVICVVEQPRDTLVIEETGRFFGLYHVLGGAISPLNNIGPERLRIKELMKRMADGVVREVIIATNPNIEGDATALYLSKELKVYNVKVTRIGFGLPVGGDLEYADPLTMARSLDARREIS
jgi:recombination protein RecR